MIRDGRVAVNGEIVSSMGVLVDPETDKVTVDGRPLSKGLRKRTYMVYKPAGVLCTRSDPQDRKTVYDLLPPEVSDGLHSAGRLDLDAEGMLILTNDGDLSQTLTHPSRHHNKTYLVRLKGAMDRRALRKMRNGVDLSDGVTLPADVSVVRTMSTDRETAVNLVLREGKKNQIKRMGDAVGHRVLSIKRTSIGRLQLPPKMKPGTYKRLSLKEIQTLLGGRSGGGGERESGRNRRGDTETRGDKTGRRAKGEGRGGAKTRDPRPGIRDRKSGTRREGETTTGESKTPTRTQTQTKAKTQTKTRTRTGTQAKSKTRSRTKSR